MKLLSKELVERYKSGRDVVPGFVTYIGKKEPVLMHCHGWQDYSDAYDDYVITISRDNGKTWSEPCLQWKSAVVPEGKVRYIEPAAFFDRDTEKLLVVTDKTLYPGDRLDVNLPGGTTLDIYHPGSDLWEPRVDLTVSGKRSPEMSFCFPIKTSRGRVIFPGQDKLVDEAEKPVHYKGCWSPAGMIVNLLGDYRPDGTIEWKTSRPVIPDLEKTSRGFYEPAMAELADGRLAMILRGDNSRFPEKPGCKWVSFSEDDGEVWSEAIPLPFTGGKMLESGSSGSALFRSIKNGKLYWIGNLCVYGERAKGNAPRNSLSIAEIQEKPFALKKDTIWVIDEKGFNDSPDLMLSNFRYYQDRITGDVVLYITRLAEKGRERWKEGDYYRLRIEIG